MKRYVTMTAAIGLAMLAAGCGSKDSGHEAEGAKSIDEVKQEAAKLDRPKPGQYSQKIAVTGIDLPGMPKETVDQMKAMLAKEKVSEFCLTREQSDKGYRDMFESVDKDKECAYSRFTVDGGKLDAQMNCTAKDGGKAVMTLNGKVAEDSSDITVAMDMTGTAQGAQNGQMKMTMHMTTTRVGDCKE
ncbi:MULTISPECIES: DUF3617 domain-containing protein [unclassified Novosphingobium]|uniref:DUF3617 domain-containing protein n=1 Tax=unclassified Novosphingobium TaxID=2644732 RepID=UPI00105360AE|nr:MULTISPECIES: DUF3617 domain-containing protein [unclassified Novosphingobium]MPS70401.1 DUF3617 domain-containing protein [Novosphingobium sp.]TCM37434.1 uncharacterized protein DUF3617 [Novosphingobium sp. ST904]